MLKSSSLSIRIVGFAVAVSLLLFRCCNQRLLIELLSSIADADALAGGVRIASGRGNRSSTSGNRSPSPLLSPPSSPLLLLLFLYLVVAAAFSVYYLYTPLRVPLLINPLLLLLLPIRNYDKSLDRLISSPSVDPRQSVSSLLLSVSKAKRMGVRPLLRTKSATLLCFCGIVHSQACGIDRP